MASLLPRGGFQLPFQKRLSNLYNDTKKSSDFVKEPVQNEDDPEIKALHRKLRIQKDRLVSWGLEWSDPTQSVEIDESLSKAGLSEVVGSIMSTIKDILAEAEPLWLSSKQIVEGPRTSVDKKPPLIQWDKGRFEDLVRDLTASIDTLFDLSRTRSSGLAARRSSKSAYKPVSFADDFRPFESTRIQTPQQIDPQTLTHLRAKEDNSTGPRSREVVFMSKTAYSELTSGATTKEPWAPLLLEYAAFDSIYSVTGIMPPMARFEKICAGLQQDPQRAPGTWTGLPRLLGYFEDMEHSRLGLVYRFPPSFNAVSFERLNQMAQYNLPTLRDLLSRPDSEPALEARFRLAYNLTNTVFDMHARGITHGGLFDANISFCHPSSKITDAIDGAADVRRPLVSSFDIFAEETTTSTRSIFRHPLDPRNFSASPLPQSTDERVLELYSLATMLLSIGLWKSLDRIVPEAGASSVPKSALDQLAARCGSLYMKAVQCLWDAVDEEASGESTGEVLLSSVQMRVTRFLEACCILDGVSGFEDRMSNDLQDTQAVRQQHASLSGPSKKAADIKSRSLSTSDAKHPPPTLDVVHRAEPRVEATEAELDDQQAESAKPEKIRLYPHVPLAPEIVEKWNTIVMPQINQSLRHFYRKHPESVEISLESVGPSPQKTQPTVLVVCTSVGKVRAILKKRVGDLFDGTTGFSLKVCRGHVVRSHRRARSPRRSLRSRSRDVVKRSAVNENGDEVEAVNPEYQERPANGASIGAWIGDRHLPPVSFGGLLMVDNKPYGMTVHHMLDDPDRDFGKDEAVRCSYIPDHDWSADSEDVSVADDFSYELSDTESEPYSETDITSDFGDDEDEEDEDFSEPGDIPGIEPGCGDGYVVTQPALDDVEEGFFPCAETEAEDHLDTFSLGEVYASSGIKRKESGGLVHEVDWALFEFDSQRLPESNSVPRAEDAITPRHPGSGQKLLLPTAIAPCSSLPGREVQCSARTSGLQTGQIMPALTSVKIYGRTSPSHTYQVASVPSVPSSGSDEKSLIPMGIPGDSGAWIIDLHEGQVCGHVLAWSQRKRVAYICPMEVLFQDIAQTLEATEISLPGGDIVLRMAKAKGRDVPQDLETNEYLDVERLHSESSDDDDDDLEEESSSPDLVPSIATASGSSTRSQSLVRSSLGELAAPSPRRIEASGGMQKITSRLNMSMGSPHGIGVNG